MTKIISLIPARGGSKGIKRKNLVDLAGKPLISWTLDVALKVFKKNYIFVSSNDDQILELAATYDLRTIKRPDDLSQDNSLTIDAVLHAIEEIDSKCFPLKEEDVMVLLQPTSPLRNQEHIKKALDMFFSENCRSLISASQVSSESLKYFVMDEDKNIDGIRNNTIPFSLRQDLPKVVKGNGAIYINRIGDLKKHQSFYCNPAKCFLMSTNESHDIDTEEDLNKVNNIIKDIRNE